MSLDGMSRTVRASVLAQTGPVPLSRARPRRTRMHEMISPRVAPRSGRPFVDPCHRSNRPLTPGSASGPATAPNPTTQSGNMTVRTHVLTAITQEQATNAQNRRCFRLGCETAVTIPSALYSVIQRLRIARQLPVRSADRSTSSNFQPLL